jgi:hypothetical protein
MFRQATCQQVDSGQNLPNPSAGISHRRRNRRPGEDQEAAADVHSRGVDVVTASVEARQAGLRAYETMIAAHATSQRIGVRAAVVAMTGVALTTCTGAPGCAIWAIVSAAARLRQMPTAR